MAAASPAAQPRSSCRPRLRRAARATAALRDAPAAAPPALAPRPADQPGAGLTAVVVGAGVGGLVVAGRLARAGYSVTLLEKNGGAGGRMQSYAPPEAPGWRFDTGPSLLLFPDRYRDCFASLGARIEDYVDVVRARARGRGR